jgi:hypothetical protein
MATPTTSTLPTRQQLDEIDALLQRMLTLPPIEDEPAEAPPAATPPAPSPPAITFPAPVIREVAATQPALPGDPVVQAWRVQWPQTSTAAPAAPPSITAWGTPVPLATLADDPDPNTSVHGQLAPVPTSAPMGQIPVAEPVPADSRPAISLFAWPLIGVNQLFNVLTRPLGLYGDWLRGPGRTAMGWLGIGLILAAGIWAAGEWLGYDWPTPDLSRVNLSMLGL